MPNATLRGHSDPATLPRTGERLGASTVLWPVADASALDPCARWDCRCGCGAEIVRPASGIRQARRLGSELRCPACSRAAAAAGSRASLARRRAPAAAPSGVRLAPAPVRHLRIVPPLSPPGLVEGYGERYLCRHEVACLTAWNAAHRVRGGVHEASAQCPERCSGRGEADHEAALAAATVRREA